MSLGAQSERVSKLLIMNRIYGGAFLQLPFLSKRDLQLRIETFFAKQLLKKAMQCYVLNL